MSLSDKAAFTRLQQASDRCIQVQGKTYLFFGGTAYLGLPAHPEFIRLFKAGIDQYGINVGSSRNNNVQLDIYPKAEAWAAERFSVPGAILMSSGFLAAQLCVRRLYAKIKSIHYAPGAHPALFLDDIKESTGDFLSWVHATVERINASAEKDFLIVSNTLNSLKPEKYDFSGFNAVAADKCIHFLLDDSHGLGITGAGKGVLDFGVPKRATFKTTIVASLAKGLSIDAGLVLSDEATLSDFRSSSLYLGASPPSPAAAYTFMHAGALYDEQHAGLRENQGRLEAALEVPSTFIPDFPVFFMEQAGLAEALKAQDIIISSFSYPRPSDPPFNRIVISSAHTASDIQTLSSFVNTSFAQVFP